MHTREGGLGIVNIQDGVIYIHFDGSEEPITLPLERYPTLKDGDQVRVSYSGCDMLRIQKV